jgi:hypothetical protein
MAESVPHLRTHPWSAPVCLCSCSHPCRTDPCRSRPTKLAQHRQRMSANFQLHCALIWREPYAVDFAVARQAESVVLSQGELCDLDVRQGAHTSRLQVSMDQHVHTIAERGLNHANQSVPWAAG